MPISSNPRLVILGAVMFLLGLIPAVTGILFLVEDGRARSVASTALASFLLIGQGVELIRGRSILEHGKHGVGQGSAPAATELPLRAGEAVWLGTKLTFFTTMLLVMLLDGSWGLAFGMGATVGAVFAGWHLRARNARAATPRGEA